MSQYTLVTDRHTIDRRHLMAIAELAMQLQCSTKNSCICEIWTAMQSLTTISCKSINWCQICHFCPIYWRGWFRTGYSFPWSGQEWSNATVTVGVSSVPEQRDCCSDESLQRHVCCWQLGGDRPVYNGLDGGLRHCRPRPAIAPPWASVWNSRRRTPVVSFISARQIRRFHIDDDSHCLFCTTRIGPWSASVHFVQGRSSQGCEKE